MPSDAAMAGSIVEFSRRAMSALNKHLTSIGRRLHTLLCRNPPSHGSKFGRGQFAPAKLSETKTRLDVPAAFLAAAPNGVGRRSRWGLKPRQQGVQKWH
jgi:hypothetical protein